MKNAASLVVICLTFALISSAWVCERISDFLQTQGFQLSISGDENGAVGFYDKAIAFNTGSSSAFLNRGQSKRAIGQLSSALKDLDNAIKLGGTNEFLSVAFAIRGSIKDELGKREEAIEDFNEAIDLNCPLIVNVLHHRAVARESMGDIEGALNDFDQCMNLEPSDCGLLLDRGRARFKLGDRSGAIADLKKLLDKTDPAEKADIEGLLNDIKGSACSDSSENSQQTKCPATSEGPIC